MKLLEAQDVRKRFGNIQALDNVSLTVEAGTIHGIVGPNGAGKSTFLKILSGLYKRDSGAIDIGGKSVGHLNPHKAAAMGLAIVPQETALPEDLTVAETIVLGTEPTIGFGLMSGRMTRNAAGKCLAEMGVELPLDTRVSELSGPARRLTMFAQVVHRRSQVIIVDEPTAGLDDHDAEIVIRELMKLRHPKRAIIFVSHRLAEVVELCDRVTAIRDGRDICTLERTQLSADSLSELILGTNPRNYARRSQGVDADARLVASVSGLRGMHLRDVSLDIFEGEILGLAGLVESGVEELMSILSGDRRPTSGDIQVSGRHVSFKSPADAVHHGVAYLPEDRTRGVLVDMSVRSNVAMPRWSELSRCQVVTPRMERTFIADVLERLNLTQHCERDLGELSGGNRQKALFARAIASGAKILIVGNPTAGVDIRGREEIHRIMSTLAEEGYSIILSSSEPEEIAGMSDRALVFSRGRISVEISAADLNPRRLVEAMQ